MKESFISVGIDIGTSTTHLIFSKITIENIASGARVPQIKIIDKEILYHGNIHMTPLKSNTTLDGEAIKALIEGEYEKAGIEKATVSTGAVIITGDTARKENAQEVQRALSGLAGEFVVSVAGPDLESIISGKGAGAAKYAYDQNTVIANYDIGGGTTNIAVFDHGTVNDTTCLDIGGRLVRFKKGTLEIEYVFHKVKKMAAQMGIVLEEGKVLSVEEATKVADQLALAMVEALKPADRSSLYQSFVTYRDYVGQYKGTDKVTFSGGVADYIYMENLPENPFIHDDLGVLLAKAVRRQFTQAGIEILKGSETIRATVVGAGSHTVEISGSTITYTENLFPLQNLPVLKLSKTEETQLENLKEIIERKMNWFSTEEEHQTVALALEGNRKMTFKDIQKLAMHISSAYEVHREGPVVVIVENDMGKVLGQSISKWLGHERAVICVDGIKVEEGDYVDLGRPLGNGSVLPVIVKTLVFNY